MSEQTIAEKLAAFLEEECCKEKANVPLLIAAARELVRLSELVQELQKSKPTEEHRNDPAAIVVGTSHTEGRIHWWKPNSLGLPLGTKLYGASGIVLPQKQAEYLIWEYTKLNPNQQCDRELVNRLVSLVRAIEERYRIPQS